MGGMQDAAVDKVAQRSLIAKVMSEQNPEEES